MKIFLFYARAGHGHKKAAEALAEAVRARLGASADIRLLDALAYTDGSFDANYERLYQFLVTYAPWLWAVFYALTDHVVPGFIMRPVRRAANHWFGRRLEVLLEKENADLVLTTHFFAAEVASSLKKRGKIRSRIAVVITDFLVHRFWVNEGTDIFTGMMAETRDALLRLGVSGEKIHITGIPVAAKFAETPDALPLAEKLGLKKGRLTLLVSSGSFGIGPLKESVLRMERFRDRVQVIVVCGTNAPLEAELAKFKTGFPLVVFGFVNNMHELMSLADVLVSRSSGLTTCEALAKHLPLAVITPIPGQEYWNSVLLKKYGAAFFARSVDELDVCVQDLLDHPEKLSAVRENILKIARPHAARDIAEIALKGLLT